MGSLTHDVQCRVTLHFYTSFDLSRYRSLCIIMLHLHGGSTWRGGIIDADTGVVVGSGAIADDDTRFCAQIRTRRDRRGSAAIGVRSGHDSSLTIARTGMLVGPTER